METWKRGNVETRKRGNAGGCVPRPRPSVSNTSNPGPKSQNNEPKTPRTSPRMKAMLFAWQKASTSFALARGTSVHTTTCGRAAGVEKKEEEKKKAMFLLVFFFFFFFFPHVFFVWLFGGFRFAPRFCVWRERRLIGEWNLLFVVVSFFGCCLKHHTNHGSGGGGGMP